MPPFGLPGTPNSGVEAPRPTPGSKVMRYRVLAQGALRIVCLLRALEGALWLRSGGLRAYAGSGLW